MFFSPINVLAVVCLAFGVADGQIRSASRSLPPTPQPEEGTIQGDEDIPKLPSMTAAKVTAKLAVLQESEKMKSLLRARHLAALTELNARWKEFTSGRGTLDILLGASKRLLEAERDISSKGTGQREALQHHRDRLKKIVEVNKARHEAGRIPIQDLVQSEHDLLEAEIQLERTKGQ